ncbi:MAG: hypothetical protein ACLSHF_14315 [[Eubacterium] siraeum]
MNEETDNFISILMMRSTGQVLQALIALKNNLIEQGRYTDAVDDVLIKITKAKKKRFTVQYN